MKIASWKCFWLGHQWTDWFLKHVNKGFYDNEMWLQRDCKRCGKHQEDNIDDA